MLLFCLFVYLFIDWQSNQEGQIACLIRFSLVSRRKHQDSAYEHLQGNYDVSYLYLLVMCD